MDYKNNEHKLNIEYKLLAVWQNVRWMSTQIAIRVVKLTCIRDCI